MRLGTARRVRESILEDVFGVAIGVPAGEVAAGVRAWLMAETARRARAICSDIAALQWHRTLYTSFSDLSECMNIQGIDILATIQTNGK
jgi:hypothetical protein